MSLQTKKRIQSRFSALHIFSVLSLLALPFLFAHFAQAANLQVGYVRLDRLAASTTTGGHCLRPAYYGRYGDNSQSNFSDGLYRQLDSS